MPKQIPSEFTEYELTMEEEFRGNLLNELQIACLSNEHIMVQRLIASEVMNPAHPQEYVRAIAEHKGKSMFIKGMLEKHKQAQDYFQDQVVSQK